MGLGVFFGVRDAAATRGQYLALSKAWVILFCFLSYFLFLLWRTASAYNLYYICFGGKLSNTYRI